MTERSEGAVVNDETVDAALTEPPESDSTATDTASERADETERSASSGAGKSSGTATASSGRVATAASGKVRSSAGGESARAAEQSAAAASSVQRSDSGKAARGAAAESDGVEETAASDDSADARAASRDEATVADQTMSSVRSDVDNAARGAAAKSGDAEEAAAGSADAADLSDGATAASGRTEADQSADAPSSVERNDDSPRMAADDRSVVADDAADRDEVSAVDAANDADASADTSEPAVGVADDTVSEFTPEHLDDDEFRSALEAMLLVVDAPAPVEQLAAALDDTTERVDGVLRELSAELSARGSGIDLRFVGDGWRFYTRSEYAPYVERVLLDGARTKLTRAALETLAVVAYRQPVTRTRVSAVRGVNVDGVMRTLLARGLIAEAGVDPETNGTMYCTTELFLERIGLASLTDLPPLAPLLPGVDLIDEINESLDTDPRYTRLKKPAVADLDLGTEE